MVAGRRRRASVVAVDDMPIEVLMAECTPSLFDLHPPFDGPLLEAEDHERLGKLLGRVAALMADGRWRTLREIAVAVSASPTRAASETSVSARLRDLRKPKFGGRTVERRNLGHGLWEYRVVKS